MNLRVAIVDFECTNNGSSFNWENNELREISLRVCEFLPDGLEVLDSLQIYIKPTKNDCPTVYYFHHKGIKQIFFHRVKSLEQAMLELQCWIIKKNIVAWGCWFNAKSQLIIECRLKELNNPFKNFKYFDLHRIFSQAFGKRVDLNFALNFRGLTNEIKCQNTAGRVKSVLMLLAKEQHFRHAVLKHFKSIKEKYCDHE